LLYALIEETVPAPGPAQYRVGDRIGFGAAGQPISAIATPDGSQVSIAPGETNFAGTKMPGIYTLSGGQGAVRVAVNLDPAESRLTPLASDELERLGAPLTPAALATGTAAKRNVRLKNAELENRQKLWRWLIVAALGFIVAETWLAGRTARGLPAQPGTKTAPVA